MKQMLTMVVVMLLVLAGVSSAADDHKTWQQRESWIIGEQNEEEDLLNELAFELDLAAALIVILPAAELGWWANCLDAAHSGGGAVTIQGKINRYQFLKNDLPYQYNILQQQLRNNPTEWHRFMQTQAPFLHHQAQLRQQGSRTKHPTACKNRTRTPPNRNLPYCPPPTGCWGGTPKECEAENTRQTHEYAQCQLRNGYGRGARQ
jgi:hypothetical protein